MGAQIADTDLCCLNLQTALDGISGENAPNNIRESFGFSDALRSAQNTAGFEQVQTNAFAGKQRPQTGQQARPRLEIEYIKPRRRAVNTTKAGLCAAGPQSPNPKETLDVTVNHLAALGGRFSKADFDALCETPNDRLALEIQQTALDIIRAVNDQLITIGYSSVGLYSDGSSSNGATAKNLNLLNPAGAINPAAMAVIRSQFRKMHTPTPPIVVGGDILGIWFDTARMGGLGANAIGAQDNAWQGGVDIFTDLAVDPVIQAIETDSNSHGLAWTPGQFQMLEWYEHVSYKEELGKDDYTQTTIDVDGWRFDFSLNYDKCTSTWDYELSKYYDLFFIPDASYTQGTNVWTFNRRLHFLLGCGVFDCAQYIL